MKYKEYDFNKYKIHTYRDKRFKTIKISFIYKNNFNYKNITKINCLNAYLNYSTNNYPTIRDLLIREQELYDVIIHENVNRYGNYMFSRFEMDALENKYTNANNLNDSLDLLIDIIYNPLVINNSFNDEYLNIIKNDLRNETIGLIEDSNSYAYKQFKQNLGNNKESYTYLEYADLKELEKINGKNLYEYYKSFLKESNLDIIIVGNCDFDSIIKKINNKLTYKHKYHLYDNLVINHLNENKKVNEVIEKCHNSQSILYMGYKAYNLNEYERIFVLPLLNKLLGSSTNSLLMENVREKNSLCYYITSYVNINDNLLFINSGIDESNYHKVLDLINNTINDIKKGKFTNKMLDDAKIGINSYAMTDYESIGRISETLFRQIFIIKYSNKEYLKKIDSVTKDDIIKVINKIKCTTIYLYKGEL